MTTPPVDRNEARRATVWEGILDASTHQIRNVVSYPNQLMEIFSEHRPQSISRVRTASNWRSPTDWSHSGSYATVRPVGTWYAGFSYQYGYDCMGDGGGWTDSVYGLPSFPSWMDAAAINQALLNVKRSKVNLATNFVERKQVVDLTLNAAQKCVNLISAFVGKHGNVLSPRQLINSSLRQLKRLPKGRNTKGLINDFLQVQYGVRPLMSDVHAAVSALQKKDTDPQSMVVSTKKTVRQSINTRWWKSSHLSSQVGYDCAVVGYHLCQVRLDYYLDNPLLSTLAQLGLTNPADLVWEEIPFSFVADWFIPVGDYLEAMDASVGLVFKAGTLTHMSRVNVTSPGVSCTGYFDVFGIISNAEYREHNYDMRRLVLSDSPWPRIPSFKNPLSGLHIAEAIALATSRLRY